jgi:act minimal PKS acyl carrier protein
MPEPGSFCLDDLKKIMCGCAGIDESVDLDRDFGEVPFENLGYDSLAVLEIIAKLQNELDVAIPDSATANLQTPRSVVAYVNARLAT